MLDDEQEDAPPMESGNPESPPPADIPEDIPACDAAGGELPAAPEQSETTDPDADPEEPDGEGEDGEEEDGEEEDGDGNGSDNPEEAGDAPAGPRLPLASVVEAILFAAREPLKPVQIARAAGKGVRQSAVRDAVAELNLHYLETSRAFEIAEISGRLQLMSRPEYAEHLMRLYPRRELAEKPGAQRLTPAALDTLSIIAYKQPVTRAEIERVRGVGCGPVLRSLIERGTVRVSGKLDVVGKPPLYGTTDAFLVEFGLGSLDELPLRNDFLSAFPEPTAPSAAVPPAEERPGEAAPEAENDRID